MAADTALLDLVTPTQGDLTGTWGNVVNNGITEYVDIAIAGTTTFNGDGAVTLVNTIGNASSTNITSTSAQYAVVRVTGTLTTPKIITFGSAGAAPYSKIYLVDNAATGDIVTFKAYGQTGVSVAVGEKCFVYYNGTDIVKAASSTADGVTTISFGSTGLTPSTATSGAVTVAGTLAIANGGTGTTSTTFVNAATNVTGTLPVANGGTGITSFGAGVATFLGTPSSANLAAAVTGETGTGALVFGTDAALTNPTVTNYVESVVAIGTVTSSNTLSLTSGTVQTVTLTASTACTFTMPTATAGKSFILIVTQASGGSGTAVFTSVKWPAGTAPTITASASAIDILTFVANGTSWFGTYAQAFA